MRFMVIVKASRETEAGVLPTPEQFSEMGKFNEALVKGGIMQAGEGLKPSSKGARVRFSGSERTVSYGPFPDSQVAGFWLWKAGSLDEAIEWIKRCPNPTGKDGEIEIRPLYEAEDFGENLTPQAREREKRLRRDMAASR